MEALGIDKRVLKQKSGNDFVIQGGVVEADVAVIEGIAVNPEKEIVASRELVEKHDMPPKVAPGD